MPTYKVSLNNAGGTMVLSHIDSYLWYSTTSCVFTNKKYAKSPTFIWTKVGVSGKLIAIFEGTSSNTKYYLYAEKNLSSF